MKNIYSMIDRYKDIEFETLHGQILGKSNNYEAVPDGAGGRRIIKSQRMRDCEKLLGEQIRIYRDKRIDVPFTLVAVVYESSMAFDVDNSVKSLLDILQYNSVIVDDNLCMRLDVEKRIDRRNPRVVYGIHTDEQTLF